jgi:hypothetical protein
MTKYELELRFKELTLQRYNIGRKPEDVVDDRNIYFQSYLDGIVWSMIEREAIEGWIEYYEKKLAEE